MPSIYRSVKNYAKVEIEINKSIFISHVLPAPSEPDAIDFIDLVKKQYKDANHNCSAYVIGIQGQHQKADDDGEPTGTAGRPILEVLNKAGVKNTVVVVTRYFGGIKLGAGGLIRAYTKAAADGLEAAVIIEKRLFTRLAIVIDYPLLGLIENQLRIKSYVIEGKEFTSVVRLIVLVPDGEENNLYNLIADCSAAQALIKQLNQVYVDVLPER